MFSQAHKTVCELVRTFQSNEAYYLGADYLEAGVRQDFIDKLFTALGWDVAHHEQTNPYEQEVKVEKPQRQQGSLAQKRADYAFSLAPNYKNVQFFVEAKKPSRRLRENRDDYFQTAKYGWNAQTGISLLTDFEETVLIDCRFKPDLDSILGNEIRYFRYTDFLDEAVFAEFYWLFSREAVFSGSLKHDFLLGVLNSKLTDFCYFQLNPERGEVLAQVKKAHVELLPVPKITPQNRAQHDELLKLVPQMLEAKKKNRAAVSEHEKNLRSNHVQFLDGKINQCVYQMYGLSAEEIGVVERLVG